MNDLPSFLHKANQIKKIVILVAIKYGMLKWLDGFGLVPSVF
jgi:hypothetical protein